jgi:type IV secretory pathway TraG/TraD family ATPase VirD4
MSKLRRDVAQLPSHSPVPHPPNLPFVGVASPSENPTLPLLVGCAGIMIVASLLSKKNTTKQGKSYWGGSAQFKAAERAAKSQIPAFNRKQGYEKANTCCLYIGTPAKIYEAHQRDFYDRLKPELDRIGREFGQEKANKLKAKYSPRKSARGNQTLYLPFMNQSCLVLGASGLGKSMGVLNPLIRSALDQDITVTVFDFKYPEQTQEIVGYAAQRGYNIQIVAPSFVESDIFNMLDFIKDSGHTIGAKQISEVLVENTSTKKDSGGSNEFFESGGASVLQSGMLCAKWLEEDLHAITAARRIWGVDVNEPNPAVADIMTVAAILNMSQFGERMKFAAKRLNPWIMQSLSQFLAAGGEKGKTNVTEGGILANAQKTMNQLVQREFIPSTCGKSTVKIDLNGANTKTLTIVGLNQDYRHVITPFLATVLDLLVSYNVAHSKHRTVPYFVSLDELPTLKLPKLADWVAQARSAGFCGALGVQNRSQVVGSLGEDRTKTIFSNCATKVFINPQDPDSADFYSKYLGDQEIRHYTNSYTTQKGGGSRSRSEQVTKVPLMEAAEFLRMPPGRAVMISPGYSDKRSKETYIPVLKDIKIPEQDLQESTKSKEVWKTMMASFKDRSIDEAEIARMFELRNQLVEELFPLPPSAKLAVPLSLLINHLKFKGYSDLEFRDSNQSINVNIKVNILPEWQDLESEAPVTKFPDDLKGISTVLAIVLSTGYKVDKKQLVTV